MASRAKETSDRGADESALLRLVGLLRPYMGRMVLALIMLIGLAAVNIAVPRLVGIVFDKVFPNDSWSLLWIILLALLVLFLARNILYFFSKYTALAVGENVSFELRKRLFERLQQMNLQYYQDNKPGQLSSRVMNDSFIVQQFIQIQVPKLLQAALLFLGIVATIYAMNWQLAVASTIILPFHLLTYNYFKHPIKQASRSAQEHIATATGNLVEKFLGIEVVKGFTGEQRENVAFQKAIDRSRQSQLRSQRYLLSQEIMADLLIGLGIIALIGFGAYQVMGRPPGERMTRGAFISFFIYIRMLYPTVSDLMSGFAKLARASASIERVFDVLRIAPEEHAHSASLRPEIRGEIRFDHVSFHYPNGPRVLDDVNFAVSAGQVCAIVGPSGAGKSTMANLLPRFNDPDTGRIFLDGVDTHDIDLKHLREHIGFAFQECFLFSSSIAENLRYAKPDATAEEIVDVARRTGAHEFISKLANGYDTVVGENGVNLSRGEKQLVNLTRAMLKSPQILILDEATASVDEACESRIVPEILKFMRGKTTLMITHRPEMLRHADIVLRVNAGHVATVDAPVPIEPRRPIHREPRLDEDQDDLPAHTSREKESSGTWVGPAGVALALVIAVAAAMPSTVLAANTHPPTKPAVHARLHPKPPAKQHPKPPVQHHVSPRKKPLAHPKPPAKQSAKPLVAKPPAQHPSHLPPSHHRPSTLQQLLDGKGPLPAPSGAGNFLAVSGMNDIQIAELLDVVSGTARSLGYRTGSGPLFQRLLTAPSGLRQVRNMIRRTPKGVRLINMGYKSFLSQPPHIWLYGLTLTNQGAQRNTDVTTLAKTVTAAQQANERKAQNVSITSLASQHITLSYVQVDRCLGVLKALGYNVVEFKTGGRSVDGNIILPSTKIDTRKLPIIMPMPASVDTGLVAGAGKNGTGNLPETDSGRMMELLVFYDPAKPEQFGKLQNLIHNTIDLPARQIVIEAMVLEISNTALTQLGVQWQLQTPWGAGILGHVGSLKFGKLPNFQTGQTGQNASPTLDATINNLSHHWQVEIQALIESGQAQVLSRPSVLTLNDRQAYIHVGEQIPIATTIAGLNTINTLSFNFRYEPVGISLNVRPRVSADGREVSMQINGQVSAEVPGEGLVIRDAHGNELASAPRISERDVQTYTRIANNTPFIIGGLISKNDQTTVNKVPLLGDIPIIGNLFKSTRIDTVKREVIIVITPYVLPQKQIVGRNLPKDVDAFDSFGNKLFRNAYRIRSEDVFDLGFLTQNPHLRHLQALADQVVEQDPDYIHVYPFNRFINGNIPGQRILVYRQMYEVVKREGIAKPLTDKRMIFFQKDPNTPAGFDVKFLAPYLEKQRAKIQGRTHHHDSSDLGLGGKALAMTFTLRKSSNQATDIMQQPVPELKLIPCANQQDWSNLLWKLNQPDARGRQRYTILIHDKYDLTRLKRAIVVRRVVQLNGSAEQMSLKNFTIGRLLLLPSTKEQRVNLIDSDVAKYFFLDEQYYPALQQRMDKAIDTLEKDLQEPGISRYLNQPYQPDGPDNNQN